MTDLGLTRTAPAMPSKRKRMARPTTPPPQGQPIQKNGSRKAPTLITLILDSQSRILLGTNSGNDQLNTDKINIRLLGIEGSCGSPFDVGKGHA